MYAYIKEKEAIGHAVTQTKWFFHELDIYFQQNNLTSTQITKDICNRVACHSRKCFRVYSLSNRLSLMRRGLRLSTRCLGIFF